VVWGLRSQPSKATEQSPIFLTYGSEAILAADIIWKSPRVEAYQEGEVNEAQQLELDTVQEARINALTQSVRYLQGVRCYHDHNIQQRSFNVEDLVLWRIQDETGLHKLNSICEGSFIVSKVTRLGSYRITDADGNEVLNSWNIEHLRKFYPWFSCMMKVSVDLFNKAMVPNTSWLHYRQQSNWYHQDQLLLSKGFFQPE